MDIGESSVENASAVEGGGTMVEIKIKTLDSQSYTFQVDKNASVAALKDQISSVVGVPVENQRLIFRGKVLKDDQLLSSYNVEDGHALHLVARQPPPPPAASTGQGTTAGPPGSGDMLNDPPGNLGGHVSHSLLMGTINIPDTGDGGIPDLNRIISAVLNSVGVGNAATPAAGTGIGGTLTVGMLPARAPQVTGADGQYRPGVAADGRVQPGLSPDSEHGMPRELEATLLVDASYGPSPAGLFTAAGANTSPSFRVVQQPVVVPDALTTMSQYLDRLEQSFSVPVIPENGAGQNAEGLSVNGGTNHQRAMSGQTGLSQTAQAATSVFPESVPSSSSAPASNNDRRDTVTSVGPHAGTRHSPTPQALGALVQRVRTLLSGPAGTTLARLGTQLESEPNLLDSGAREDVQTSAVRDGHMLQNLGALLLELGRTTLTLRMGRSPAESAVNAGPAVFISPSGPNPMMVQRPPPRAIASMMSGSQPLTVRHLVERTEGGNSENGLTGRPITERAEGTNAAQQGNVVVNPPTVASGPVQGAISSFNDNGGMRVVPVRTRHDSGPEANTTAGNISNDANASAPLGRSLDIREALHQRAVFQSADNGTYNLSTNSSGQDSTGNPAPTTMRPIRAQVHVQSWAVPSMQALGSFPQLVFYSPSTGEAPLQSQNQGRQASTVGGQTGFNGEGVAPSQDRSGSVPTNTSSYEQGNGLVSEAQPPSGPDSTGAAAPSAFAAQGEHNNLQLVEGGGEALPPRNVDRSGPAREVQTSTKADVTKVDGDGSGCRKLPEDCSDDGGERPPEARDYGAPGSSHNLMSDSPLGLGLGGLQPRPSRTRRRGQGQQRQAQGANLGVAGGGLSGLGNDLTLGPSTAQSFLQNPVSRIDRLSSTSDGNAMEQSVGQLTQGLLPLLGGLGSRGNFQNGDSGNLGHIMGQLMSRTDEGNSASAAFPSSMLRGVMGQIVQSPFMENLVQQVITGGRTEETHNSEQTSSGLSTEGDFDFASVMQQMLPVVSQMLGGRPTPSSSQQVASTVMSQNPEVAARAGAAGQSNDAGRWREALTEEEAARWTGEISADVEQQQCAAPQRPFSDVYVRSSPNTKRQKTELKGTALKLERGAPEELLSSVAETVTMEFLGSNGPAQGEPSELAQNVAETEGLAEAYMVVLFHDLATRVAADPDFDDGSRFPNAARVFQQQKAPKERDGG